MATGQAAQKKSAKRMNVAVTIDKEKIKDATVIDLSQRDEKGKKKNRIFVVIEKIDREWAAKMGWPSCCSGPLLYYRRR